MALAHFYKHFFKRQFKQAEHWLKIVEVKSENDLRWSSNCLILRSRIQTARKKYSEGEQLATQVLEKLKDYNQPLCEMEALMARTKAAIKTAARIRAEEAKKKKLEQARTDLEKALLVNKKARVPNAKIEAVCNLNLARLCAEAHNIREAEKFLQRWTGLKGQVEHRVVHEIGETTERKMTALTRDFIISWTAPDEELDYKKQITRLQKFLLLLADERREKIVDKLKLLGLARQSYYVMLDKLRGPKKPKTKKKS